MTTYSVVPSGSHWRVQKGNGSVVSNHRKKKPAIKSAKRAASSGDRVVIKGSDGKIQRQHSY